MKKSIARPQTRWSLIAILVVATALTYAGIKRFMMPKPQLVDVFAISTPKLEYGHVVLVGTLSQDEVGTYLLTLGSGESIILDLNPGSLNNLLNQSVTVEGDLVAPVKDTEILFVKVANILAN